MSHYRRTIHCTTYFRDPCSGGEPVEVVEEVPTCAELTEAVDLIKHRLKARSFDKHGLMNVRWLVQDIRALSGDSPQIAIDLAAIKLVRASRRWWLN